jgi:drug/metabolite transporter (DMT)-like permease
VATATVGADLSAEGHPSTALTTTAMLVVMVVYGLGAPIMKLISAPPLVAASVRLWLALPLLGCLTYASGRRVSLAMLRQTALAGLLFGMNLAAVFAALQRASVAIVSVILALQPGIVLVVGARWLGERATRWHIMWTAVGILGVAVVVAGGDPELRGDGLGLLLAVCTLLTYTAYYLLNRRHRAAEGIGALQWMFGVTLFASLFFVPVVLVTTSVADFGQLGGTDWLYLGIAVCGQGILGHTLMSWVHRFVPAGRSSLFLLGMNVVAVAAAWPIHGETVTIVQALGGAVVLGAVAAVIARPSSVTVTYTMAEDDVREWVDPELLPTGSLGTG